MFHNIVIDQNSGGRRGGGGGGGGRGSGEKGEYGD